MKVLGQSYVIRVYSMEVSQIYPSKRLMRLESARKLATPQTHGQQPLESMDRDTLYSVTSTLNPPRSANANKPCKPQHQIELDPLDSMDCGCVPCLRCGAQRRQCPSWSRHAASYGLSEMHDGNDPHICLDEQSECCTGITRSVS
jgi:hypothetical protein